MMMIIPPLMSDYYREGRGRRMVVAQNNPYLGSVSPSCLQCGNLLVLSA